MVVMFQIRTQQVNFGCISATQFVWMVDSVVGQRVVGREQKLHGHLYILGCLKPLVSTQYSTFSATVHGQNKHTLAQNQKQAVFDGSTTFEQKCTLNILHKDYATRVITKIYPGNQIKTSLSILWSNYATEMANIKDIERSVRGWGVGKRENGNSFKVKSTQK